MYKYTNKQYNVQHYVKLASSRYAVCIHLSLCSTYVNIHQRVKYGESVQLYTHAYHTDKQYQKSSTLVLQYTSMLYTDRFFFELHFDVYVLRASNIEHRSIHMDNIIFFWMQVVLVHPVLHTYCNHSVSRKPM